MKFQPLNLVCDNDGDGVPEVCVAAHYRVMIFDGATGRKESELRYHRRRPYGWFGLADVDADGQMELVTIGDLEFLSFATIDATHGVGVALRLRAPRDTTLSLALQSGEGSVVESRPLGSPCLHPLQPGCARAVR